MAGIYNPTITNYPNGVVTVVSNTGTPYSQVVESMGSFVYSLQSMYFQATSVEQMMLPVIFSQYDVNGTLQSTNQVNTIDPFQTQLAINVDLSKKNIALEGRTVVSTQILPSDNVHILFTVNEISNKSLLKGGDIFEKDDFYNDYSKGIDEKSERIVTVIRDAPINTTTALIGSANSVNLSTSVNPKKGKTYSTYWIFIAIVSVFSVNYILKNSKK